MQDYEGISTLNYSMKTFLSRKKTDINNEWYDVQNFRAGVFFEKVLLDGTEERNDFACTNSHMSLGKSWQGSYSDGDLCYSYMGHEIFFWY